MVAKTTTTTTLLSGDRGWNDGNQDRDGANVRVPSKSSRRKIDYDRSAVVGSILSTENVIQSSESKRPKETKAKRRCGKENKTRKSSSVVEGEDPGSCKLSVRVLDGRVQEGKNYAQYQVLVKLGDEVWVVWRRFSMFQSLAEEMGLDLESYRFPSRFPFLQLFTFESSSTNADVIAGRVVELDNFLMRVVHYNSFAAPENHALRKFLGINPCLAQRSTTKAA